MSKDVRCPYCGAWQEINHDDGQGYAEDQRHQQQCHACDKTYVFTTSVRYYYSSHKADCLNGAPHDMKSTGSMLWPDSVRCRNCSHEVRGEYREPVE